MYRRRLPSRSSARDKSIHVLADACHTLVPGRSGHSLSIRRVWSLCVSNCRTFCVLALHGFVPRLAVCLHASFSEEYLHQQFYVFRSSSSNVCSSSSMAAGGARPYLPSASVCPSAPRTSGRFPGDTMFSVIFLDVCFVRLCPTCRSGPRRTFGSAEGVPVEPNSSRCPALFACPPRFPFLKET